MVLRESITQNCALQDVRNNNNPLRALKNIGYTFTLKRKVSVPPRVTTTTAGSLSVLVFNSSTYCKTKPTIA